MCSFCSLIFYCTTLLKIQYMEQVNDEMNVKIKMNERKNVCFDLLAITVL